MIEIKIEPFKRSPFGDKATILYAQNAELALVLITSHSLIPLSSQHRNRRTVLKDVKDNKLAFVTLFEEEPTFPFAFAREIK